MDGAEIFFRAEIEYEVDVVIVLDTVFGRVVKGQNVVYAIRQGDTIQRIDIIRIGAKAVAFKANQDSFDALLAKYRRENQ